MNLSQSSSIETESDCIGFFSRNRLADSASSGSLITAAVLSSIASPFTIYLNVLVMVAVKIKRRLQTHPNILLAGMAVTDLLVGLVVQPLYITKTIFLLQGKGFHEFCGIEEAFTVSFTLASTASLLHLVLISGERYLAMNHTFTHAYVVTKTRLMVSSAVAWIITVLSVIAISYFSDLLRFLFAVIVPVIVVLQLLVYKEARRHEKQILSQQISLEAGEKFENEKKALKLTTTILAAIFACIFFPFIAMLLTWRFFGEVFSHEIKNTVRQLFFLLVMLNSVLNPIIYSVRARQFRVAFIELLLRKNFHEAQEFERKLFGPRHSGGRPEDEQERDLQEQNEAGRNPVQANRHQANGAVVLAPGAIFDENDATSAEHEPVSSNAPGSTFRKAERTLFAARHNDGRHEAGQESDHRKQSDAARNSVQANQDKGNYGSAIFLPGAIFDENDAASAENEPISSNSPGSTFKKAEEELSERTNPVPATQNEEDEEEVLVLGISLHYSHTTASQNGNI